MDWLWQGLLSNLLWELLIVAAGVAVAVLRKRESKWAVPILFGLVTAACLLVGWFTITGRSLLSRPAVEITPENVEDNIKLWADDFGMSLERQPSPPDSYFLYVVRLHGGDPVQVFRSKTDKPNYLQFASSLTFAAEHEAIASKMTKAQTDKFAEKLTVDLARSNLPPLTFAISFANGANQQAIANGVLVVRGVPITNLNEAAFGDDFDELARAAMFMRGDIAETLEAFQRESPFRQ